MKAVQILGLMALFLVASGNAKQQVQQLIKACTNGRKLSAETLERYQSGDFPNDRDTKCTMRCIGLNMGVYDDTNGVNIPKTWELFRAGRDASEEKNFVVQHRKCIRQQTSNIAADDYCERVYASYQCYKHEYQAMVKAFRELAAKVQG